MIKAWIMSDMHLDVRASDARYAFRLPDPRPEHDVVIIAGDIREGAKKSVRWIANAGFTKPVVFVLGNHESYRESRDGGLDKARAEARLCPGLHLLQDDFVDLDVRGEQVRIFGTTLWTDYRLDGEAWQRTAMLAAQDHMQDHGLIKLASAGYRSWRAEDALREHEASVSWLKAALDLPFSGPRIVVTHHAPSARSISSAHLRSALNPAYASNLETLVDRVDLWVHGHVHERKNYRIGEGQVVCNPRGYAGFNEHTGFDPELVVVVEKQERTDASWNGGQSRSAFEGLPPEGVR
jgi:predicted phosphodiesterase